MTTEVYQLLQVLIVVLFEVEFIIEETGEVIEDGSAENMRRNAPWPL